MAVDDAVTDEEPTSEVADDERRRGTAGLLRTVLGCPVVVVDDPAGFWPRFEAEHCFLPGLQQVLTASSLLDRTAALDPRTVQELVDPLGIAVTVFRSRGDTVLVGPYVSESVAAGDVDALLGRMRVPSAQSQPYRLYRARYAIVDSEYVMRAAGAMLEQDGVPAGDVRIRRASADGAAGDSVPADPAQSAAPDLIDRRYAIELDFMHAVTAGDEKRALSALQAMAHIPQLPSYLTTPYLGATVLRIMTRVAAQQSGLPPVTIDAISQTYAQQLHRSGQSPDLRRTAEAITAMVREFCTHVQRYRQRPYSRLVRQVVDEIELHLSSPVSPDDLARRFGVSASHLARTFRAQTGQTLTGFVASRRCARAAHLLEDTRQPVRDVAAYVGYPDANYFVKVFRSVYGMTPTAYRAQRAS